MIPVAALICYRPMVGIAVALLIFGSFSSASDQPTISTPDGALVVLDESCKLDSYQVSSENPKTITASFHRQIDGTKAQVVIRYLPGMRANSKERDQMDVLISREIENAIAEASKNFPSRKMIEKENRQVSFKGGKGRYVRIGSPGLRGDFSRNFLLRMPGELYNQAYLAFTAKSSIVLFQVTNATSDPLRALEQCVYRIAQ